MVVGRVVDGFNREFRSDQVWDDSLVDLIGAVMDAESYEALESGDLSSSDDLDAPFNREKIIGLLDQKANKQFGNDKRAVIELVQNALDARPADADEYRVEVDADRESVTVRDDGIGMSQQELLQNFVVPFNTGKDRRSDRGRFGVGAQSVLHYPLNHYRGEVRLVTHHDGEAHALTVTSEEETMENSIESLHADVQRYPSSGRGTTVETHMGSDKTRKEELGAYLHEYLWFFDRDDAVIIYNGDPVNPADRQEDAMSWSSMLTAGEDPYEGDFRMLLEPAAEDGRIVTFAGGIKVKGYESKKGAAYIDLPAELELSENRNSFKQNAEYEEALDEVHQRLYEEAVDATGPAVEGMRELIPAIQNQLLAGPGISLPDVPRPVTDNLFGEDAYAVCEDEPAADDLQRFVGTAVDIHRSETSTFWSLQDGVKDINDLLDDYTRSRDTLDPDEFLYDVGLEDVHTSLLTSSRGGTATSAVELVDVPGEEPLNPAVYHGGCLYVNGAHPVVEQARNGVSQAQYSLKADLFETYERGPERAEERFK